MDRLALTLKKATEDLEQEAQKIGVEMYKEADNAAASDDGVKVKDHNPKGGDDTVEGEVVDEK